MTKAHNEDFEALGRRIQRLWRQGDREEAVAIASRTNYAARKSLGRNHEMYAGGLSSLARMYLDLERFDEAEAELLEGADIAAKSHGLFTSAYAETLSRLVIVYQASGRDFDAKNLGNAVRLVLGAALEGGPAEAQLKNIGNLHRALQSRRRALQHQFARRAEELHDYEEAERSYRRAIEDVAEDERSTKYAVSLDNLAGLLCIKGAWADAERFATEALSLFEVSLGPGHVDTLIRMNGLAIIMNRQGNVDAAIRLYKTGIQTCREVAGTSQYEQW
jgi:tetratricopeptide (TPR) repeat protein